MGNKNCTKCKLDKPITDFKHRSSGRVDSWCRLCNNVAAREQYARNPTPYKKRAHTQRDKIRIELRLRIARIRKDGCSLCPESDESCLDFHHVGEKDKPVGHYSHVPSFERELIKCILVCANCHRKIHAGVLIATPDMCLRADAGKLL